MPELPDITVYLEALESRVLGDVLERVQVLTPFLLRTAAPPLSSVHGRRIVALRRLGKRLAFGCEGDLWLVLHLMIAGRLHWTERGGKQRGRAALAFFHFGNGTLLLTEAGTKKRASLHVVAGEADLARHDPGGLEVLGCSCADFAAALAREQRTLKRALTSPHLFSGIGNAYSDEILHAARLSPVQLTRNLSVDEVQRLHEAVQTTLALWIERLRIEAGKRGFPEKVTAFHPDMAVHGRFGQACRVCGTTVQRICYAENETNYCPGCQTGGRILADRSLSRLLKADWPRTVEQWEQASIARQPGSGPQPA